MSFSHRKLLPDLVEKISSDANCSINCNDDWKDTGYCEPACLVICPDKCKYPPPSVSPPPIYHSDDKTKKMSLITVSVLASVFLLICLLFIYVKSRRASRSRRLQGGVNEETHDDFVDEGRGPVVHHPIWYIRTIGLQPSVINSITVCKYKRGDGLVEGTDCSVCLSEFEEDETLRLLPKCNHAFHLPCIDTWLRSHTNCPLCRAPIVTNPTAAAATSSSGGNIQNPDETPVGIPEGSGENDGEIVEEDDEGRREESCQNDNMSTYDIDPEVDEMQPIRRSVSLDSVSAFKISQAVVVGERYHGVNRPDFGRTERKEENSRAQGNQRPAKQAGDGPSFLKRSVSCGGKFLPRRCGHSRSRSGLPS